MKDQRDDAPWGAGPPDGGTDPERLAALLDGRVEGAERDDLLARLADHDDDLALFAEAAAIQRALEEEDAAAMTDASVPRAKPVEHVVPVADIAAVEDEPAHDPDVIPIRRRPAPRVNRRLVQLAAVLAGVTLLPLAWRAGRPGAVAAPTQAVAMLEGRDAGWPAGLEPHPLGATRGGGDPRPDSRGEADPRVERLASARVGARAVDLELAIREGDVAQRQILVGDIRAALQNMPAPAATGFAALEQGADRDQLLADLEAAVKTATGFLDADYVALGGWAEAARVAAARRDAEFFRGRRTERTLARAQSLLADDEAARAALAGIATARAADPPDWAALGQAVHDLLTAIAS